MDVGIEETHKLLTAGLQLDRGGQVVKSVRVNKAKYNVYRKRKPLSEIPGELLQQKQMPELLQAQRTASVDGSGLDPG